MELIRVRCADGGGHAIQEGAREMVWQGCNDRAVSAQLCKFFLTLLQLLLQTHRM